MPEMHEFLVEAEKMRQHRLAMWECLSGIEHNLRIMIEEGEISQRNAAYALGVSHTNVMRWYKGERAHILKR